MVSIRPLVSYVHIVNMTVKHNGGSSVEVSGYNNTVKDVIVMGNGCGGMALSGGDQVTYVHVHALSQRWLAAWVLVKPRMEWNEWNKWKSTSLPRYDLLLPSTAWAVS